MTMNCLNRLTATWRRAQRWRLASLLLAGAIGGAAQAQVIFNETFTGGSSSTGFTITNNTGSCGWDYTNPGGRSISGGGFDSDFVIFDSDACGNGLNNSTLTSGTFDASAAGTYTLDLSFQYRFCCPDFFDIDVWDGSTWNNVYTAPNASVGYGNPATTLNFDISAATGNNAAAQIRFTYEADFAWWVAMDNIAVTYTAPPSGCTGVPAPGATTGPTSVCSGVDFTLGLTNATTGSGVSYQWYVSTTSAVAGFSPVGTDADMFTTNQTVQSWYYCDVTCDDGPDTTPSDVLQVDMTSPSMCYCTTLNYTNNVEPITLVDFAGINNASCDAVNCDGEVVDYTAGTPGNVIAGQSYTIIVKGNTDGGFTNYITAFFDWDQDGVFEDAQQVGSINGSTGLDAVQASTTINVPLGAMPGATRMRIVKDYSSTVAYPSDPCGTYDYGQAEDYTINVTVPSCTAPDYTVTVTPNCPGGFDVDVFFNDFGSGASATIQWSLNSVPQTPIAAVIGSNILPGGPFASGSDVDVTVEHESDSDCNTSDNDNTYVCPPANDDCAGAIALTVNPDFACGTVTSGTNVASTASVQPDDVSGTPNTDVWYSFVATGSAHRISLINIVAQGGAFNTTDMGIGVYEGLPSACDPGGMLLVGSSDPETFNVTGLTASTTYYVRVYGWSSSLTYQNFDICIGTPPPAPANDDCGGAIALTVNPDYSCGTVTSGTTTSATASVQPDVDSGTPDDDVWYSFVATATTHRVSLLNVSGFADMGHSVYRALPNPCDPAGMTLVSTSDPDVSNPAGLNIGETYFVRVYAWGTGASSVTFDLCIGTAPPPPANDLCADAIMLSCNSSVSGSTASATHTGAPTDGCDNTGDPYVYNAGGRGVWYTVQGWDGGMTASLCGSSFDTQIWIGTTTDCSTFTCVAGNDDAFSLCASSGSRSIASWTASSSETYYIYVTGWATNSGDFVLSVSCGDNNNTCAQNGVTVETDNDSFVEEDNTHWEIRAEGTNVVAVSGNGLVNDALGQTTFGCLPDGCYYLVFLDDFGDGMDYGGYVLREQGGAQRRIIDNKRDAFGNGGFSDGFVSQIANNLGFCLPMGDDRVIFTSTDKIDWRVGPCNAEYIYANDNPAVTAQYGVSNATSGYQMWWFDPNGGYSFRRYQSHSTNNGLPVSATRACGFRLNNWSGNQLQQGVLYNVKVRGRVNGTFLPWGQASRFMLDDAAAQCPNAHLMDIPGNQFLSCGQFRDVAANAYVHARPVKRMQANCTYLNANRYQFRFRIIAEDFVLVKTSATGQYWVNTIGLECGKSYDVDVRASFDNGATWCNMGGAGLDDPAWGDVCMITMNNCLTGGNASIALQGNDLNGALTMYPNPNHGDQLLINLTQVEEGVNTVSVDIYDGFGKRVAARTIAVQDGFVNTVLELNGELATGMYLVNITAGSTVHTERLVIQP